MFFQGYKTFKIILNKNPFLISNTPWKNPLHCLSDVSQYVASLSYNFGCHCRMIVDMKNCLKK